MTGGTGRPREHRFHVCLSDEELAAIDEWRFAHRVATRAEAVRRLVSIGLPKLKEQTMFAGLNESQRRKDAEAAALPMPEPYQP